MRIAYAFCNPFTSFRRLASPIRLLDRAEGFLTLAQAG